jgi:16S rRNA (uracil1498-N3)-methyltransferase
VRPRFYSPDVTAAGIFPLPDDESHHLQHVLRLATGAELSVFNGRGQEWGGRVTVSPKRGPVMVELIDEIVPPPEPPVLVTLGIGVLKGDQMDTVVREATMLGVAGIVPFTSDHVTVSPRAWASGAALTRWTRIAVASAKQCGRAVVPAIAAPEPLPVLIDRVAAEVRLICVEPRLTAATSVSGALGPCAGRAAVLIGPEGGWSDEEVALAQRGDYRCVHLGPRTLRAETAPTVLLSALWAVWGWS